MILPQLLPPPGLEKSSANKIILPRRRCYLARGKRAHHLLCDWCTFSSTRDAFRKKLVPVIDEVCMHEWRGGVNLNKSLIVATRHPRCVCKPPSLHVQMGVLKCVEIGFWICFFLLPFVSKNAKHGHFWQVWGEVKNPLTKAANLWGGGVHQNSTGQFFQNWFVQNRPSWSIEILRILKQRPASITSVTISNTSRDIWHGIIMERPQNHPLTNQPLQESRQLPVID